MRRLALESLVRDCALRAMLYEIAVHPKPGLVGPCDAGAHGDMTRFTFIDSAAALVPWMALFARAGYRCDAADPRSLLPRIRRIGLRAERAMFAATGGVNTHKGLLFSFGLICAAAGVRAARNEPLSPEGLASLASRIVAGIVRRELESLRDAPPDRPLTAGERLYLRFGVTGIRGEAERGFPTVVNRALPFLENATRTGTPPGDAGADTLLVIMQHSDDTNVLHRSGTDGLRLMRGAAADILAAGGTCSEQGRGLTTAAMRLFVERNISPGGSADLLAVAFFLNFLSEAAGGASHR